MEIEIAYGGKQLAVPVQVVKWGYTYRLVMTLNETEVSFEPDEEGSYRAITEKNDANVDPELVEAVIAELGRME